MDYGARAGEIRYSKMIGWLLDPQQNHGLGAWFTQRFLDEVFGADAPKVSPRARVMPREWRNLDVLLVDYDHAGHPVMTLVIENKTDSVEHMRSGLPVPQTTWYEWVLAGEFDKLEATIQRSALDASQRRRLLRTVRNWRVDTRDYRTVAENARWFVYLTPRPGDAAAAQSFTPITYQRLERLLAETEDHLLERGLTDAEKVVRDFRLSIHRRFDLVLSRAVAQMYAEDLDPEQEFTTLDPELAGLALTLGILDADAPSRTDSDFLDIARRPQSIDAVVTGIEEALARRGRRQRMTELELTRLIDYLWTQRPQRGQQNHTKDPAVQELMRAFVAEIIDAADVSIERTVRYRTVEPLQKTGVEEVCIAGGGQGLAVFAKAGDQDGLLWLAGSAGQTAFPAKLTAGHGRSCPMRGLRAQMVESHEVSLKARLFIDWLGENCDEAGLTCCREKDGASV